MAYINCWSDLALVIINPCSSPLTLPGITPSNYVDQVSALEPLVHSRAPSSATEVTSHASKNQHEFCKFDLISLKLCGRCPRFPFRSKDIL